MTNSKAGNLLSKLSDTILKKMNYPETETNIDDFLKSKLPSTHHSEVSGEMKKHLVLKKVGAKEIGRRKRFYVPRQVRRERAALYGKDKRELELAKLPKKGLKFDEITNRLHPLWCEYMRKHLQIDFLKENGFTGDPSDKHWPVISAKLMKADLHGAWVTVVRSTTPEKVGVGGVIVLETKQTFQIVTKSKNPIRIMPKKECEFMITLDGYKFYFCGKDFCARPSDRISKFRKAPMYNDI